MCVERLFFQVIIENSYAELRTVKDRLTWLVNLDRDSLVLGTSSWSEQFKSAVAPPDAHDDARCFDTPVQWVAAP